MTLVVAAEPYASVLEPNMAAAAEFVRLAGELGHVLCVASAARDDVLEGTDMLRRRQRLEELTRFSQLHEAPISASLVDRAGSSEEGTNDHRDLRLLAEFDADAVHYQPARHRAPLLLRIPLYDSRLWAAPKNRTAETTAEGVVSEITTQFTPVSRHRSHPEREG